MTRSLALATGVVIAAAAAERPASVGEQGTFRVRTDLVSVTVAVMAGRQPVTGLRAADFVLTDNGVRQTVDMVSIERVSLDLTVVFAGDLALPDGSDGYRRRLVQAGLRQLLPADQLRVVWLQRDPIGGGLVGQRVYQIQDAQVWPDTIAKSHHAALTDGIFYALAWPVEADRRHLIVALTDGWDGNSSALEVERLPRLAAHSDAVLHAVFWPRRGIRAPGIPDGDMSRRMATTRNALVAAAESTGGTLHRTDRAPEALALIIEEFRTSYLLRYAPNGVQPGGWHEVHVRLERPGSFTIRARKGYEGGG